MNRLYALTFVIVALCTFFVSGLMAQNKRAFPEIKAAEMSFAISGNETLAKELVIKTRQNKPAYRLTVYAVNLDKQNFTTIESELNGIGDASTRFDTKYEDNLLNPDRWGHGQIAFTPADFSSGKQKRYMVFRLRHMRITVTVSNAGVTEDFPGNFTGIKGGKVTIDVRPDRTTRSRPADIERPALNQRSWPALWPIVYLYKFGREKFLGLLGMPAKMAR